MSKKQKKKLARIIATIILLVIASLIKSEGFLPIAVYIAGYVLIGYDVLIEAVEGIFAGQVFDENFLMAVATVGALALGDYREAVAVMLFNQIGELFESYAVNKSRRNIAELMDIRPDYANIERDGQIVKVDPDEVEIGSIIIVQPGEKIPLDGVVVEGEASLNTAALTGESIPKQVEVGDEVISGFINMDGVLRIQTEKEFGESAVSKILQLVENASSNKSKSENFISKFASYYTPTVVFSALALAILPPVYLLLSGKDANFAQWIYRAFTFLVISCPCALVISIPLSFFAGIGGASNQGILIKGSNYLETLANVKCIVFDKTGTITKGVFEVDGIHHNKESDDTVLYYAACAEGHSNHPIARSIKNAYGKEIDLSHVTDTKEYSGKGIVATIDGKSVAVGNGKLMNLLGVEYIECSDVGTVIHIAIDKQYQGHLLIKDVIKPNAEQCMSKLKEMGVKKLVMLTGDNNKVAAQIAQQAGLTDVYSHLLPQQKVEMMESILEEFAGKGKTAFVGDGINDAPVLSRADIGVAMGALGSDAAIEAADVVLMDDDLLKIAKSIKISKKCLRIVYENIYFAIGVKVVCLILGALGYTGMWAAIFADVGVMVISVLNAIRALFVKRI